MTDPNLEADAVAEEKARRIVGRVVLRKLNALVLSWKEEEKAEKRFVWWVLFGLGFSVFLVAILPFAFDGHPKVRLFIMSLGAGIILAVGMIIWSHRRYTKKPNQPVEKDARKGSARRSP